jgi:hypothetical protein
MVIGRVARHARIARWTAESLDPRRDAVELDEEYDRGPKWAGYQRIGSLTDYLLVLNLRPAPDLKSQYRRVSGSLAIPDGNATGLSDTLTVSGSSITAISRVTVEVYVTHGEPQELTFVLVSPRGTEVQLVKESVGEFNVVRDRHEGVTYDDFALSREAGFLGDASFARRPRRPLHLLAGEKRKRHLDPAGHRYGGGEPRGRYR